MRPATSRWPLTLRLSSATRRYERLVGSLLIKVTEFFRDPKVWDQLRDQVVPSLVEDARRDGRELRVWSAGCSSGEEAYSLAMTIAEVLDGQPPLMSGSSRPTRCRGDRARAVRRGLPGRGAGGRPRPLRARYFTPSGTAFEVASRLRSKISSANTILSARVPFPDRPDPLPDDLIYFTESLERIALETFAYSLRRGRNGWSSASCETVTTLSGLLTRNSTRGFDLPTAAPTAAGATGVAEGDPTARSRHPHFDRAIRFDVAPAQRGRPIRGPGGKDPARAGRGRDRRDLHYDIIRINTAARRVVDIQAPRSTRISSILRTRCPRPRSATPSNSALKGKATSAVYEVEPADDL